MDLSAAYGLGKEKTQQQKNPTTIDTEQNKQQ